MISICPRCGNEHRVNTSTRSIGMFSDAPTIYAADFEDAPQRITRERAQRDYCQHWNERRESTPLQVALMASVNEGGERFDHVALVENGVTLLVAGVPQAFPVDVPADDFDALITAFNGASRVNVECAPLTTIQAVNGGAVVIPLLTIEGKK